MFAAGDDSMKMIAQCTQSGKSINAAMDWAESEIEVLLRYSASKTRTGAVPTGRRQGGIVRLPPSVHAARRATLHQNDYTPLV